VLCSSHLSSQGGAHGALLLQGEGRGTLALLGDNDDRLDGGDDRNQHEGGGWRSRRGCDDVGTRESGVVGGERRAHYVGAMRAGGRTLGRGSSPTMKGADQEGTCGGEEADRREGARDVKEVGHEVGEKSGGGRGCAALRISPPETAPAVPKAVAPA
jgi:hypothetical protein